MGQGHRPELWGGTQDVNEPSAISRGHSGSIGDANQIRMPVVAEPAIEVFSRRDQ